jgi:hypothetical protein
MEPLLAEETITIGRIRIDSGKILPETILTFTALETGSRWKESDLDRELKRTGKRLADSGYFYDTRVIGIPSADDPLVWNIKITVSDGFHYRFGGGNSYALFGLVALNGRREELRVQAGYNRNSLVWQGISPGKWYWQTGILYTNQGSWDHPPEWHRAELAAEAGWQPLPDLRLGMAVNPVYYHTDRLDLLAGPRISLTADFFPEPFWLETAVTARGDALFSLIDEMDPKARGEASALFRFGWKRLSLCGLAAGGLASPGIPGPYLTDLYNNEDRQVRSGWSPSDLQAADWLFFSGELRLSVIEKFIPPFFALGAEFFLFTDQALAPEWRDAWGAGLRIKADNPVFVYFTFAMGWNREGEGRFTLTTTAGF